MSGAKVGRIAVRVEENVTQKLKAVGLSLHSPEIVLEMQRGAELMAQGARAKAPYQSGLLRQGIYTMSLYKLNLPNNKQIQGPRYLPRPNQVLIVSGTYYGKWVEYGRKGRKRDLTRARKASRSTVGRVKRHPFFRSGLTPLRPTAEAFIKRRIQTILERAAR